MKPWGLIYGVFNLTCTIFLLCLLIQKCEEARTLQELLDVRTETVDEQNRIILKLLERR